MASPFSGKAGRNAAIWQAQQAQTQRGELGDIIKTGRTEADAALGVGYDKSLEDIGKYYQQGRSDVTGGLTQARADVYGARDSGIKSLQGGYGAALGDIDKYYGKSADTLQTSAAGWQPLIEKAGTGYDMYMNALGLSGKEGTAAAQNAFQTGPGYQWQVDQATSQAQRAGNKLGAAYGGNTADATTRLASNLANQEYSKWLANLQGFQGAAERAQTGYSGVMGDLANTYEAQGAARADLNKNLGKDAATLYTHAGDIASGYAMDAGKTLGSMAQTHGQDLATMHTGYGQSLASNALGYAQQAAGVNQNYYGTVIPAGGAGMMAGQNAAANRVGAIMGGAQMGMQMLGGAAGSGGGIFGKLWG